MKKKHIIFILPNIYDHISGVSNKYISFIHYLSTFFKITLLHISHSKPTISSIHLHKTSSLHLPLYPTISIQFFTSHHLKKIIEKNNENIIIFNSEFIWLHSLLIHVKEEEINKREKENTIIKLIPNMHTDIDYYIKEYLTHIPLISHFVSNFSLSNYIDKHLIEKKFDGIIVTGNVLYKKYSELSQSINVNEIDYEAFSIGYKPTQLRRDFIWKSSAFINIICCCRLSVEKNVEMVFDLSNDLIQLYLSGDYSKLRIHIIGDGPHRNNLEKYVEEKYITLKHNTIFYGAKKHDWIADFYKKIYNPLFLFCSISETFGKTSIEALTCAIPVFQIESPTSREIFTHRKNGFLFSTRNNFIQSFDTYMKMSYDEIVILDNNMKQLAQIYDQKKIFQEWNKFLADL